MPEIVRTARLERFRAAIGKWTARDWLNAQLGELGLAPLPKVGKSLRAHGLHPAGEVPGVRERELLVMNEQGIHARPAAAFVRCAREFESIIEIIKEGESYPAKSILSVLSANLNRGSTFVLRVTGRDAAAAVERLEELLTELAKEDA